MFLVVVVVVVSDNGFDPERIIKVVVIIDERNDDYAFFFVMSRPLFRVVSSRKISQSQLFGSFNNNTDNKKRDKKEKRREKRAPKKLHKIFNSRERRRRRRTPTTTHFEMISTRYDRQMRLWGENGQKLLSSAKILVLDSGATSAEAAKNLILGGISQLTMCDSPKRLVEERDLGNNFMTSLSFFKSSSTNSDEKGDDEEVLERTKRIKRGDMVCKHLKLLNRNVEVNFWEEDPREMIERFRRGEEEKEEDKEDKEEKGTQELRHHRLQDFDVILASQLDEPTMIKLDDICQKLGKKLLTLRSNGCFGTVKISGAKTHCVVEAKPENRKMDLRLSESGVFTELEEFAENFEDLEAMDEQRFAHVPWAVLLLVAKKRFDEKQRQTLEDGDYEAQKQFKEFLKSMRRTKTELNFEEALENVRMAWQKPEVPENVSEFFEKLPRKFRSVTEEGDGVAMMETETTLSSSDVVSITDVGASDVSTKLFWIFVAALEEFTKRNKKFLPLDAGALPDMTSTTDAFVGLQRVYLEKAQKDQREMLRIVKETIVPNLKTTTRSNDNNSISCSHGSKIVDVIEKDVDEKQLEEFCIKFCKNARDIRFVSFTSLADERDIWRWENKPEHEGKKAQVASFLAVDSPQRVCAYSYALLRASDAFEAKLCRKAGTYAPEEGVDNVVASSGTEKGKSMLFHRMTSDCAELRALVTKNLEAAMFQSFSTSTSPTKMDVVERPPSNDADDVNDDGGNGSNIIKAAKAEEAGKFLERLAWEVVRSQGGEIHAVASVVGGVASQEAIKLITGQFVPSHGRVCVHLADGSSAVLP